MALAAAFLPYYCSREARRAARGRAPRALRPRRSAPLGTRRQHCAAMSSLALCHRMPGPLLGPVPCSGPCSLRALRPPPWHRGLQEFLVHLAEFPSPHHTLEAGGHLAGEGTDFAVDRLTGEAGGGRGGVGGVGAGGLGGGLLVAGSGPGVAVGGAGAGSGRGACCRARRAPCSACVADARRARSAARPRSIPPSRRCAVGSREEGPALASPVQPAHETPPLAP